MIKRKNGRWGGYLACVEHSQEGSLSRVERLHQLTSFFYLAPFWEKPREHLVKCNCITGRAVDGYCWWSVPVRVSNALGSITKETASEHSPCFSRAYIGAQAREVGGTPPLFAHPFIDLAKWFVPSNSGTQKNVALWVTERHGSTNWHSQATDTAVWLLAKFCQQGKYALEKQLG